jgi:hypothetical protein
MPLQQSDRPEFLRVLNSCAAMYRADMSPDVVELWWNVLAEYDFTAIRQALTKHIRNPDSGQFMPKPADVIKFMSGTTQDAALMAWAKVHSAIRRHGSWSDAVFDDPIVHAVIQDMGGWIRLCEMLETDVPFRGKEFENRYRAYARQQERVQCVPVLIGRSTLANQANGYEEKPSPALIGNEEKCREILESKAKDQMTKLLGKLTS